MAAHSPDKRVPTIAELTKLGCSEVLVRVSQYSPAPSNYGPDGSQTAVQWQAIVKHVNASLPWAVAVRNDPDEAEGDARRLFVELNGKPHKVAQLAAMKAPKAPPKPAQKPPAKAAPAVAEDDMDDLI